MTLDNEPRTLDEKVDALRLDVAVIKERLDVVKDHESRLRSLEKRVYWAAGGASVLGAILSQFVFPNVAGG